MSDLEPSLPERAVARLAMTLDRSRPSRRSFFARVAIAGSALALKPWGYLVEDASAYDVVCGSGNECSDGWTAFCCTVTGSNSCPPGSYAAGWWKADASGFCCGGARYYIDCNATCDTNDQSWECHCASGTCDRRRVACNQFRYGQCHQEIACYGPVVCRVITCQPPWLWDPACTTSSATDNRTASHSAPCLDGVCWDAVERLWMSMGGSAGALGSLLGRQEKLAPGRYLTRFQTGAIFQWDGRTVEVHGSIWSLYAFIGAQASALGYPTANTGPTTWTGGSYSDFETGAIYDLPGRGTFEVHGAIFTKWAAMGRERGYVGYPIADTRSATRAGGRYSDFETGAIYYLPGRGTFEVHGAIFTKWAAMGRENGALGFPVSDTQDAVRPGGRVGHARSSSSIPIIDSVYAPDKARVSLFESGAIIYHPGRGTFEVHGPIFTKWVSLGREKGRLGYPTSDTFVDSSGNQVSRFQFGRITRHAGTGSVAVDFPGPGGAW